MGVCKDLAIYFMEQDSDKYDDFFSACYPEDEDLKKCFASFFNQD